MKVNSKETKNPKVRSLFGKLWEKVFTSTPKDLDIHNSSKKRT